ncbi:hypothetical protein [Ensifer sp. SSB1]|jgi:hypothetical protein|nr:hypothetical protein [Ensifer sp. SSB1]
MNLLNDPAPSGIQTAFIFASVVANGEASVADKVSGVGNQPPQG